MPQPPAARLGKPISKTLFKVPKQPAPQQPIQVKPKWQKKRPTPPLPPPQLPPEHVRAALTVQKLEANLQEVKQETTQQVETSNQTETKTASHGKISSFPVVKSVKKQSPQPPKKVFLPPIKLPPSADPDPALKPRPYARKFKTPLMCAEERYRQNKLEKEETESSKVTTSTPPSSPPFAANAQPPAAESIEKKVTAVTEVKAEEAKIVSKEGTLVQDTLSKKVPSQIPLSKPLISVVNKKSPSGSSNVSSKQSLEKTPTSAQFDKKGQTASKNQTISVSQARHEIPDNEVQSGSNVVTFSVTEQQQFIKKSSSSSISATQCAAHENVNLQGQAGVALKAEDVKNINVPLTQEEKISPPQPTKIPKVTPSFKVKTFKMPAEKKEEKSNNLGQKEAKKGEMNLQQEESEKKEILEGEQLISGGSEAKTEVRGKEKKIQATPSVKGGEVEVHMRKGKVVQNHESEVKLSASVTLPTPKLAKITSEATHLGQGRALASHSHQRTKTEQIQKCEEVVVTESVVQQSLQRQEAVQMQKQQMKQRAADTNKTQMMTGKAQGEPEDVSVKGEGKLSHKDEAYHEEITDLEKFTVTHKLLSQIKELEGAPSKADSSTVRTIISQVPDWIMGSCERKNLSEIAKQQSKKKLKEMMVYVKNIIQAKLTFVEKNLTAVEKEEREDKGKQPVPPPVPPKPDMKVFSGATTKISKMAAGSCTTETTVVEKKKSLQESRVHQELSERADQKVSSPLASIRTPSPTFISIESRRVDSPLRVTPSPPPYRSVGTPPPHCKSYTPISTFSRATPSPTLSRSEKLMKLRDSTSKLSHGVALPPPMPVPEHFATDKEQSSPFNEGETLIERSEHRLMDVAEMVDSMMTVRDKKSFFEEAQRAEVNKTYIRKDPIDIPERLGPDSEETAETVAIDILKEDLPRVDLSKLVNRFESPQPKLYTRKEPIVIAERLGSDTEEAEADPHMPRTEEIPTLKVKAIKDVFETGEHSSQAARELREQIERREPGTACSEQAGHSEVTSVNEQFCTTDNFGNMTSEIRSEVHSGSSLTRGNPPSYADVVRGRVPTVAVPPEASSEELLRNFQQSWAESQGVFQNLGFSVTEQRTSQIITHQQQTVVTGKASCAA